MQSVHTSYAKIALVSLPKVSYISIMMMKQGDTMTDNDLNMFLARLNEWIYQYDKQHFPNLSRDKSYRRIVAEAGRKFIKLIEVRDSDNGPVQRSVYCFLDRSGNIYKAASWRAPAKHIRGNITDQMVWGKALGPYGAAYLR